VDGGDHELRPAHPVQRCIGEDRVELAFEGQRVTVDSLHLEPLGGSRSQKLLAQIGAKDVGAGSRNQFGQLATAAAKVENPLAPLWRKQIDHRTGKIGDEPPFLGVVIRLPALHRLRRSEFGCAHSVCPGCHGS